jgi:hypothetical protein
MPTASGFTSPKSAAPKSDSPNNSKEAIPINRHDFDGEWNYTITTPE